MADGFENGIDERSLGSTHFHGQNSATYEVGVEHADDQMEDTDDEQDPEAPANDS